ncbi:MAG: antibiotic biosynthesis monooxygenase [Myxococcales bacterium]|nr:antibiotic biosynthesis monooxygenase [Myxococcales bacterium]
MIDANLHLVVKVVARAGKADACLAAIEAIVAPTREESGCREFRVLRAGEDAFFFVEAWTSSEAYDQHFATPHIQAFLAGYGELFAGAPVIERCAQLF